MFEILKDLGVFFKWVFTEAIPQAANAEMGVLGEFLDSMDHAKAIILGIVAAIAALIAFIKKEL